MPRNFDILEFRNMYERPESHQGAKHALSLSKGLRIPLLWLLCALLEEFKVFDTHYLAAIRPVDV